ncbi:lysophospholipid acyltransferase family protein [Trichlorobacter ammonificans]|uniref:Lipid A biosynthesis lauroyl acyltransferase n=1 Tax=Trichlorobacter ammonificans TaxID=2916410 RepID=A0ABN8HCL3_9BACT|nr:lysophospholipid acyltransferase family protein [Trichlorobacter ammonificans]CAH2030528.1 Lipid A biosynthesis lauroyl acyltransferase [Trichlorobacter ammonificans]
MKRMLWFLQAGAFYLFTWLVALLPAGLSRKLGTATGELMHRLLTSRRRIAEENIARSLDHMRAQPGWSCTIPDAAGIARETFRNIGRSLVETCRLYHGRGDELIAAIEVRGREHYDAARARGKGLIFLTGHCGNWELVALAYARLFNSSMSVVARRQNNPYLNRMVETMRMHYDNRVIYKDNALKNMMAVIRRNGVIGLLVDQAVFPEEGSLIPFLGRPAWASKAPVLLARKTGVAVLPAFIHREGDRHVIELHPELVFSGDASEEGWQQDVKRYSAAIEQFIVRYPTNWYWVHRRWKRAEGA